MKQETDSFSKQAPQTAVATIEIKNGKGKINLQGHNQEDNHAYLIMPKAGENQYADLGQVGTNFDPDNVNGSGLPVESFDILVLGKQDQKGDFPWWVYVGYLDKKREWRRNLRPVAKESGTSNRTKESLKPAEAKDEKVKMPNPEAEKEPVMETEAERKARETEESLKYQADRKRREYDKERKSSLEYNPEISKIRDVGKYPKATLESIIDQNQTRDALEDADKAIEERTEPFMEPEQNPEEIKDEEEGDVERFILSDGKDTWQENNAESVKTFYMDQEAIQLRTPPKIKEESDNIEKESVNKQSRPFFAEGKQITPEILVKEALQSDDIHAAFKKIIQGFNQEMKQMEQIGAFSLAELISGMSQPNSISNEVQEEDNEDNETAEVENEEAQEIALKETDKKEIMEEISKEMDKIMSTEVDACDKDDDDYMSMDNLSEDVRYIFEHNDKMKPFENNSLEWVRICPEEMWVLPVKNYKAAQTSFVLCADKKYKHLLLGRNPKGDLMLAVPDCYRAENRKRAMQLGFIDFIGVGDSEPGDGIYGYWIKKLK